MNTSINRLCLCHNHINTSRITDTNINIIPQTEKITRLLLTAEGVCFALTLAAKQASCCAAVLLSGCVVTSHMSDTPHVIIMNVLDEHYCSWYSPLSS